MSVAVSNVSFPSPIIPLLVEVGPVEVVPVWVEVTVAPPLPDDEAPPVPDSESPPQPSSAAERTNPTAKKPIKSRERIRPLQSVPIVQRPTSKNEGDRRRLHPGRRR